MDTDEQHTRAGDRVRRRRFTVGYKRRVVEETLAGDTSVSVVARRHDLNANQLFNWRWRYRNGLLEETANSGAALMPVHVADAPVAATAEPPGSPRPPSAGGEVAIHLSGGHRVVVRGDADHAALRVALEVLSG